MGRDDRTMDALRKVMVGVKDVINGLCDETEELEAERAEWLTVAQKIEADANKQTLLLLGSFSAGKSTLLNALLGESLLPTASSPCTSVTTEISFVRGGGHRGRIVEFNGNVIEKDDYGELIKTMVDGSSRGVFLQTRHVELFFDIERLPAETHFLTSLEKMGTKIVDCPGYDSPYFALEDITEEYLQKSCCTFWVSSARQFGDADEVRRLSLITGKTHRLIPIITMSDLLDDMRRMQTKEKFFEHLSVFFSLHKEPRFVSAHKWIEARELRKKIDAMPEGEREAATKKAEALEVEAGLQQVIKDMIWGGRPGQRTESRIKAALNDLSGLFKEIYKSCR